MQLKRLVMVGGPFSSDTPEGCEANIVATEMLGIEVAAAGGAPIVPNSMGRSYTKVMNGGYVGTPSYETWIDITLSILANCHAFIVMPTWERSSGTRREIAEALFFGVPVFYDIPSLKTWLDTPDRELRVVSDKDKYRLRLMREALLPNDLTVVSDDLNVVREGLAAAKSLDDLARALGPNANAITLKYERLLSAKYDQLLAG